MARSKVRHFAIASARQHLTYYADSTYDLADGANFAAIFTFEAFQNADQPHKPPHSAPKAQAALKMMIREHLRFLNGDQS